jgi:hypothetical protein
MHQFIVATNMGFDRPEPQFVLQVTFVVAFIESPMIRQMIDETNYDIVLMRKNILFVIHRNCLFHFALPKPAYFRLQNRPSSSHLDLVTLAGCALAG